MAWTLNGIYQIRNKVSNKIYIGSSRDLLERKRVHFMHLRNNNHTNKHLQASFNKYGEESFVFEILLTCYPEMLIWYEQQFLDQWKPEYNIARNALSPMKDRKHSEETKIKMSLVHKNKTDYPEFHASWENPYYKGKSLPTDVREKISRTLKGRKLDTNRKEKLIKRLNENPPSSKIHLGFVSPNSDRYENIFNLAKFCREHDLDRRRFHELTSGKRLVYKGWVAIQESV